MVTKPKSAKPGKKAAPVEAVPPSWKVTAHITIDGDTQEYDLSVGLNTWWCQLCDRNGPDYELEPSDLTELKATHIESGEVSTFALTPAAFNVFAESEPDGIYSDIQSGIPLETAVRRAIDSFEFAFGFCTHRGCDGYFYERSNRSVFNGFLGCPSCNAPADAPFLVGHMFGLNDAIPADYFELSDCEQQDLRDRLTMVHSPLDREQKVNEDAIEDAKEAAKEAKKAAADDVKAAAKAARSAVDPDAQVQAPKRLTATPVTPSITSASPPPSLLPVRRRSAFGDVGIWTSPTRLDGVKAKFDGKDSYLGIKNKADT